MGVVSWYKARKAAKEKAATFERSKTTSPSTNKIITASGSSGSTTISLKDYSSSSSSGSSSSGSSGSSGYSSSGSSSSSSNSNAAAIAKANAAKAAAAAAKAAAAKAAKEKAAAAAKAAAAKAAAEKLRQVQAENIKKTVAAAIIKEQAEFQNQIQTAADKQKQILSSGGRTKTYNSTNKSGQKIETTNTYIDKIDNGIKTQERVFTTKNLDTGEITTKTFAYNKKTGKIAKTDDVSYTKSAEQIKYDTAESALNSTLKTEEARLLSGVKNGIITQAEGKKMYDNFKAARIREFNAKFAEKESGFITETTELKGLDKLNKKVGNLLNKIETENTRISQYDTKRISNGLKSLGLGILEGTTSFAVGMKDLPKVITSLVKSPKLILQIPASIKKEAKLTGDLLKISPTRTIARIGTSFILMNGSGKILKSVKLSGEKVFGKLTGRYKPILNKKLTLKVKGKDLVIETGSIGTLKKTLKQQAKFAGTTQPIVTGTQANRVLSFWKRKNIVRKPFPFEENLLPSRYKKLLTKFDAKKISSKEFAQLEVYIQKKFNKSLLERSMYVDPTGAIRISRLGISEVKKASIRDILKGDFTIKKSKPVINFFTDVKVELFPKTKIFKSIKKKLSLNKALNTDEIIALVKWQTKKSGKFKPIGSTTFQKGIEPELTIAPGEIVKRVKRVGFTVVKGKRVPIIQLKIIKGTKKLNSYLDDLNLGKKLSKNELKELRKLWEKETNTAFTKDVYREISSKKFLDIRRKSGNLIKKLSLTGRTIKAKTKVRTNLSKINVLRERAKIKKASRTKSIRKKSTQTKTSRTKSPSVRTTRVPSIRKISPRIISVRGTGTRTPSKTKKIIKSTQLKKQSEYKTTSKPQMAYTIKIKQRGKLIKLNKRYTKNDAKDLLAGRLDNTLARTAQLVPLGKYKKFNRIPSKYSGSFSKVSRKLREYKIKKGKKIKYSGFIEKRKYAGDRPLEIKQLQLARRKIKKKAKTISKKAKKQTKKKSVKKKKTSKK